MTTYVNPGLDASGNGNNWTTENINYTSSGSTFDTMTDVPTLTSATAANFCVLNPLQIGSNGSLSSANLNFSGNSAGGYATCLGTIGVSSGKYYWEVTATSSTGNGFGIATSQVSLTNYLGGDAYGWMYYYDGTKYTNNSGTSYGASYTTNDVIGFALDADAGTITAYKNGVSQGTMYSSLSANTYFPAVSDSGSTTSSCVANFGQRPFAYTPPANYVALNTYNLPTPTIGATASSQANKYMDATLYTGTAAVQTVTNAGGFQPDLVWVKIRSDAGTHILTDAVRGANKQLYSNLTNAEGTSTVKITGFTSTGFTLGADDGSGSGNANATVGGTYVGWQWNAGGSNATNTNGSITSTVRANATSGFSVVTYTGNGSAGATFGHGLGVAPSMVIIKDRVDGVADWRCYHVSLGNTKGIFLNLDNAAGTDSSYWNNTTPSSTVVTLGTNIYLNASGHTYVAYCFAAVAGYSAFGSYTGNGSTDGIFIYTGFRPKYVMVKRTDTGGDWRIQDGVRNPYNACNSGLWANLSNAENTTTGYDLDLVSNGFKYRNANADSNASGGSYIYMAFAESPFKYANAR